MSSYRPANEKIEEVLHKFDASTKGLNSIEVADRLKRFGENKLPEREALNSFRTLARQFESSLVIILLVAAVISFALGDKLDGSVILAAISLNVLVGFIQEYRAERALKALQKVATFTATVLRDGRERDIDAKQIVPGDILVLHSGQKVGADARLLEIHDLEINEAALTGESEPVVKTNHIQPDAVTIPEQTNMVFAGTVIVRGRGLAVVTASGISTELGKIASLLQTTITEKTPLQKKLIQLSWNITVVILFVALLVFLFGVFKLYDLEDMFTTSVAVAVAAIPEGLAVVVTVILAIGMQHMLKRRALARSLVAAEALGSVTVIATDKTGTVTEGYMRVVKILTHNRQVSHPHQDPGEPDPSALQVLKIAALASDATIENPDRPLEEWDIRGNLTERALVRAAAESGFNLMALRRQYPRISEVPFDSTRRFMAVLCDKSGDGKFIFIKGAPEVLISHAQYIDEDGKSNLLTSERKRGLENEVREMSRQGLRALAVAQRQIRENLEGEFTEKQALAELVLVGVVGIQDPLRKDAAQTIQTLKQAGIRTVMLTGDNQATAQAIATGLGLLDEESEVMDGRDLEKLKAEELQERVKNVRVFARVSPKDKLRIIDAWQARGEVVAMTGDGVNDAPALKSADVGVALGSGTDVAKEAADLVLLDNNLSTIANAVFEGRIIYRNIKRVILYLVAGSFVELSVVVGALLIGWPLPLGAAQILWINLVTDSLPTISLTQEPAEEGILDEPPIRPTRPILGRFTKFMMFLLAIVVGGGSLLLFELAWADGQALAYGRTLVFTAISVVHLMFIFTTRTLRRSIMLSSPFKNPMLILAILISLGLQVMAVYSPFGQSVFGTVPLGLSDWALIVLLGFATIFICEISKVWFRKRYPVGA
ncbi:cation-transporting P-type ATPase [Candidatus Parcubacteria bacterium]|jgi:Ca2+-transporting ATPase|nr:MAG: cation-transporting P-type ATPase [Candidatus Parcubacteria bacterium]